MSEALPWTKISRPNVDALYAALRVNPDNPFDFFWGVDLNSRRLLILKHKFAKVSERRLPKLKEIEVLSFHNEDGSEYLIWALDDVSHEAIFHELCLDITKAAVACKSEEDAVRQSLDRTKQWQRMMRATSVLSRESQMGLIGELLILSRYLMGVLPTEDAVKSWVGPLGAPKDFDLGALRIESKTRSSGTSHEVIISSELQLELSPNTSLVLCVIELMDASGIPDGYSVAELAQKVRNQIHPSDSSSIELFEERLESAGLSLEDDYSLQKWLDCGTELFLVSDSFPKLVSKEIPNPVSKVRYSIDLDFCEDFLIDELQLHAYVGGE